jgi:hypothetical protein
VGLFDLVDKVHAVQQEHQNLHPLLTEFLYDSSTKKIPGPDDWLPASGVPTWCPRWHVMAWRLGHRESVRELDAQSRWAMDRGTALHRTFQELWMGPMGWILGGWRCPHCGHLHTSGSEPNKPEPLIDGWKSPVTPKNAVVMPERCETCDHKSSKFDPFRFEEPWCRNEAERVRGPCDGILNLPAHAIEFFDLKTTSGLKWVRKEPRIKDVIQLHWYMDTYDIRRGRIVYINPGEKRFEDAVVEHVFSFDTNLMTREKRKIRGLREALKEESRPVPACPYGGKLPYGDCACVELAVTWASRGS